MRSIIHFHMPSFHAAVEQLRNPDLAGKPVIVTPRFGGIELVISASPEAMKEGVVEGMTARHAGRLCPDAVFIPARWAVYKDASEKALDILADYSPFLEPHGLDRAYMDVTVERPASSVQRSASNALLSTLHAPRSTSMIQRIKDETGLTISAGIARNKLVARAAASACEPGGFLEIAPGDEREFLAPIPVAHLPGVGPKIEKRLLALGITTIGDLASIPQTMLMRQFGALGSRLHKLSHGMDFTPVTALYPPECIITEHTFPESSEPPAEPEALETYLARMSDSVSARLKRRNRLAGSVSLRIEFDDREVALRSYTPKSLISSPHEIYSAARRLLGQAMYGVGVISIRLTLGDLRAVGGFQLDFLEDTERKIRLQSLITQIHARFGERALVRGTALVA